MEEQVIVSKNNGPMKNTLSASMQKDVQIHGIEDTTKSMVYMHQVQGHKNKLNVANAEDIPPDKNIIGSRTSTINGSILNHEIPCAMILGEEKHAPPYKDNGSMETT